MRLLVLGVLSLHKCRREPRSDSASGNYVLMSLLGEVLYYSHPSFLTDTFFKPYNTNYVSFTTIAVATAFNNSLNTLYISTYLLCS